MKYLIFLFVAGCTIIPSPNPGPGPKPVDTDLCKAAEENIERLQCLDSSGEKIWVNPKGVRFAETCKKVQDEGLVPLNPKCIANAKDCEEVNICPTK